MDIPSVQLAGTSPVKLGQAWSSISQEGDTAWACAMGFGSAYSGSPKQSTFKKYASCQGGNGKWTVNNNGGERHMGTAGDLTGR